MKSRNSLDPIISIVIPCLNYGKFLPRCLNSIRSQSYKNIEVIVVDGGSSDDTLAILEANHDIITSIICEPDDGMTDALNKGSRLVSGQIFGWLNADDSLRPDSLELVADMFLEGHDMIAGSCCDHHCDIGETRITASPVTNYYSYFDFIKTSFNGFFPQPACFVSSRLLAKTFPLDVRLRRAMDYQYFLRILKQNPRIGYTDTVLADFYFHGANITLSSISLSDELIYVCKKDVITSNNLQRIWLCWLLYANITLSALIDKPTADMNDFLSSLIRNPSVGLSKLYWSMFLKSLFRSSIKS